MIMEDISDDDSECDDIQVKKNKGTTPDLAKEAKGQNMLIENNVEHTEVSDCTKNKEKGTTAVCFDLIDKLIAVKEDKDKNTEVSGITKNKTIIKKEVIDKISGISKDCIIPVQMTESKKENLLKIKEENEDKKETNKLKQNNRFCKICFFSFTEIIDKSTHEEEVHHNYEDKKALQLDITKLTHEDFVHSCKRCVLKFLTYNCLMLHTKQKHKITLQQNISGKCKLCYKEFAKQYNRKCHEAKKHAKDKHFLSMDITEDLLIYKCQNCELKFVSLELLETHMEKHGQKEYCKLCYRYYAQTNNFKKHKKLVHSREEEKEALKRDIGSD